MSKIMSATLAYSIEFQMTLLLFIALAGYLLAARINQSAVVGEILVGLIVGPSVLGLITYTDFVQTLAGLGAVILLFVIGFEFDLRDLMDVRYGIIGLIGIIVPWIGGYYLSLLFGFGFESAIFVGTAMTATSIAITANVLREIDVLHTKVAKAIIGTAVIDDVLSLLVLAITADIVSGHLSVFGILLSFTKDVGFIIIAGAVGLRVLAPMLKKMDKTKIAKKYPEFVFISAMAIAFFYATCAELIGTSATIGAFIAGVTLRNVGLVHSKNIHESTESLYIIFASIFFISLGILVDIHSITQETLLFLVALTLVAIITKVVGCGLPARLLGMSWRDSMILGVGMSPRGEVAMIVALLGLSTGLITQDIFAVIVMVSLLTTVITPIIYREWFYRDTAPA